MRLGGVLGGLVIGGVLMVRRRLPLLAKSGAPCRISVLAVANVPESVYVQPSISQKVDRACKKVVRGHPIGWMSGPIIVSPGDGVYARYVIIRRCIFVAALPRYCYLELLFSSS